MPARLRDPDDPREWLRKAHSHMEAALEHRPASKVLYEERCFHTQQAAEMAIKAMLVQRRISFPPTHDLADLLTVLNKNGVDIPPDIRRSAALTRYAVRTRYIGLVEDVTELDYQEAVALANRVLAWAVEAIGS